MRLMKNGRGDDGGTGSVVVIRISNKVLGGMKGRIPDKMCLIVIPV